MGPGLLGIVGDWFDNASSEMAGGCADIFLVVNTEEVADWVGVCVMACHRRRLNEAIARTEYNYSCDFPLFKN